MLCFSSICPHPPIIIPEIGKENLKLVKKTTEAMNKLHKEFKKARPEVVIIISPHGLLLPNAFILNLAEKYQGNFEAFGDFVTKSEFKGEPELAYKIRESLSASLPITMVTKKELDHGVLVPLYFLTAKLKNFSILPMTYSLLDYETHYNFGRKLKEIFLSSNKNIAFIASGDLSHRLTFDAPAGYSPQGRVFDDQLIKFIKKRAIKKIINLDKNLIEEAGECGLRSFSFLLGILETSGLKWQAKVLSYEGPFGVGYLVINFTL